MIKYNENTINDWFYSTDNIIKVYRNNAVCYYKINSSGDTPTYDLCYAVVNDITQYQDREFEDVFDDGSKKWYKLNNLYQYEEYGIYGSGRTITHYDGKLTIDDGYEYQYSGGSWVNVGEVSGSTATLPDVPFTLNYNAKNYDASTHTIPYTEGALNAIDAVITGVTTNIIDHHEDGYIELTGSSSTAIRALVGTTNFSRSSSNPNITIVCKAYTPGSSTEGNILSNRRESYNWMYRHKSSVLTFHGTSEQGSIAVSNTEPNTCSVRIDSSRLLTYNNWTQNTTSAIGNFDYGSNSNGGALFAGYYSDSGEMWKGVFYWIYMSLNTLTDEQVQQVIAYNEGGGQTEYPIYYDEKSDPLNNLTFSSTTEAEEYAYNNCVYDGMKAIIDGNRYVFDSEDGWVVAPEYYYVEDVTPSGNKGWAISGSSVYNPNTSYYDDYDLETTWTGNDPKVAKITIFGYDHFTYYLRSYHYYSTSYGYVTSSNIDELLSVPSTLAYNSSSAITNTYGFMKASKSEVSLNNYRRVTYNNLDKTVEHTFYVVFTGYKLSSYNGDATILIPKEQTNENWEQVTFSASSNVAGTQKSLYIDGAATSNGGTETFYQRWMIGLPVGSHSSSTNYSSYDYCGNVTSSTFTSVAGEQRQVNFTYDSTTNKTLQFNLVDESGNTLSHSYAVYYRMDLYNSCNVHYYYRNLSFPTYLSSVKVGGRFSFSNYENKHYIYGYTAPPTGTTYYADNYNDTFNLVYTALTREAVTVTYTTYDPNDSETPGFNTDITWPYNGGSTSSTTSTSFDVPYTYSYKVSQTNNKFSADSQSYTAGQSSRTIIFTLYPNNREFASVADLEAYQYAWEGMKATVGDTRYEYKNGEWVEKTSKDSDFVIGDFNTFVSSSTEVTEGYYIIYNYSYDSSYANKDYLFSWNSGNTWNGYYTLGNMNHTESNTSVPISSSEIIDDAVWEFKDAGSGNFYIRNVGTNKYWYYLGTSTNYGVPLTDNANDATPVSIQDWRSCLAFVEKQSGSNLPVNKLYGYTYRYGWYGFLASDGNNQYYMRKYVP